MNSLPTDLHPHISRCPSQHVQELRCYFLPTPALLCFDGGGETCHLWVELWAGFIKVEEAQIHLSDRPWTSLLIAPSSDAASSSNWQNVGVDGIKMAALLFTSMTAACQLHGEAKWTWTRERQRSGREKKRGAGLKRCRVGHTQRFIFLSFLLFIGFISFLLLLLTRAGI